MRESTSRTKILRALIAVAGIVVLVLALTTSPAHPWEPARRAQCINNLKQLGLALQSYAIANQGKLPTGTVLNPDLPPAKRLSWYTIVEPPEYEHRAWVFDRARPWDAEVNRVTRASSGGNPSIIERDISGLYCPSSALVGDRTSMPCLTSYVGIAGVGRNAAELPKEDRRAGVFGYDRQIALSDITDGTSTTMAIAEMTLANGPWTAGARATIRGLDQDNQPYIGKNRQFGGNHQGGVVVAFMDGSVRFVRESIDPRAFEALSTIAGCEQVDQASLDVGVVPPHQR